MKKKFIALEAYRGFAAVMIAAIHFDVNSPLANHPLAIGYYVQFFFCLSGFVMYFNYKDRIENFKDIKFFVKKRFLRLYPLHLFFLLVFLIIEIAKYVLLHKYNLPVNNPPFEKNNVYSFFANILLLQTFLYEYTFNTPSWSISAEFYSYIIFAVLITFRFNLVVNFSVILLIFLFRLNEKFNYGDSHTGYRSFLDCVYGFYWGILFCQLYIVCNKNKIYNFFKNIISFILLIVTFFALTKLKNNYLLTLPIFFGLLLFFSCDIDEKTRFGKLFCNKILVYFGKISYSFYLSHLFIFWSLNNTGRWILKLDTFKDDDGITRLDLSVMEANIMVIICYTVTTAVSALLYKHVEKRFYNS